MVAGREGRGRAGLRLVDASESADAAEETLEDMLAGWARQQRARNLAESTVVRGQRVVRAFVAQMQLYPWAWTLGATDEWFSDQRAVRHLARSTVRAYQGSLRGFCEYVTDPAYGWVEACLQRFDDHPIQVITDVNCAVHVAQYEGAPGKRAFTREELQALLDHADAQVERARALGRKGWLAAFRDATILKVAYGYGLRRRETAMLDVTDFGPNPHAAEFGDVGVCYVRHGKAQKGSPPKRRSVLTVWPWTPVVIEQWKSEALPLFAGRGPALWPTERAERVDVESLTRRLREYRDTLGLDPALDFHSLRRSYVTHLIEDGWDPRFVQEQVGHEHASTTAIYTCVSSDFRTRTLRRALDDLLGQALGPALSPARGQAATSTRRAT